MATEKTKSNEKDEKTKTVAAGNAGGEAGNTQAKPQSDVAAKTMTKAEILALHKKKAESKDEVTSDVIGYWDSDGDIPITGIVEVGVIAIDSSIDRTKPSMLLKIKATVPTVVKDKEDVENICKAGDLVGVWFKPGMRDIRTLGGLEVTLSRNETKDKDVKKGNDMKGFDVFGPRGQTGQLLRLTEDRREKSKEAKTVFDVKQEPVPSDRTPRNATPVYGEGDHLPF